MWLPKDLLSSLALLCIFYKSGWHLTILLSLVWILTIPLFCGNCTVLSPRWFKKHFVSVIAFNILSWHTGYLSFTGYVCISLSEGFRFSQVQCLYSQVLMLTEGHCYSLISAQSFLSFQVEGIICLVKVLAPRPLFLITGFPHSGL